MTLVFLISRLLSKFEKFKKSVCSNFYHDVKAFGIKLHLIHKILQRITKHTYQLEFHEKKDDLVKDNLVQNGQKYHFPGFGRKKKFNVHQIKVDGSVLGEK